MYVAVTRSKENLLVTGSRFRSEAGTKYYPDQYLEQLLGLKHAQLKKNPDIRRVWHLDEVANSRFTQTASWPLHPIGDRNRKAFDLALSESVDWQSRPDALGLDLSEQIEMLLEERAARAERLNEVELPVRISASRFKDFVSDPEALAARFKRPVPEQPYKSTMQGTLFHSWIEKRFAKSSRSDDSQYPDVDYRFDLDSDREDTELTAEQLLVCAKNFEASRWFGIEPREVECEVQVTVGTNTFVCKMDAVFDTEDGVEIIDWKTGKLPDESDEKEMRLRTLQLALYRMAYSALTGIPEEKIQVSLFFVNHGREIRPAKVPSTEELLGLWKSELLDRIS
jgi:DNA helicase-2/ATP-dependent DNA helicase PcrA